ncbi:MAG: hypothetical protein R6V19_05750, partial [Armatimonadota bacterium]
MRHPYLPLFVAAIIMTFGAALTAEIIDLESHADQWAPTAMDPGSEEVTVVERDDDEGRCLAVGGRLPGSFGAKYRIWDDWRGFTELTFDLWVPADAPGDLDIFPYIKDKQYW